MQGLKDEAATISATPDLGQVFGESDAFAEILAWSRDRPVWQRDALRRLVAGGPLSSDDLDELTRLCLDPTLPHEVLSGDHVSAQQTTGVPISLLRIEKPTGINALAPDQMLEFSKAGLTVIYGDNGSGKSGFVRILKHACRTRDRGVRILRDIEGSPQAPQSASLAYVRGPVEQSFAWTPDTPANPDLPSISIFDSRSANVHVEKTNAVAYIPQPMQVLEGLAAACDKLKSNLDAKLAELSAQTPLSIRNSKLHPATAAGAFVLELSATSNVAQLDLLAKLSDDENHRLITLEGDLAQDPQRASTRLAQHKSRLDDGAAMLKRLAEAASANAFQSREKLRGERDAAVSAARLASDDLFSASPLPHIGEPTWRALWEAARKYSDEVAYPEKHFPDEEGHDELCVLCQQPLGDEAIKRRNAFEGFVKSSTRAEEEAAELRFRAFLTDARQARIDMKSILELTRFIDGDVGDAELAISVRRCASIAAWRLRALLRETAEPQQLAFLPEAELAVASAGLGARAAQLAADHGSPEYTALLDEYRELKAREGLSALVPDLKAEIERLKVAREIRKAIKDTAKRGVTDKNKDLSDRIVTNALRGRFAREIEKLKLARMPVELKKIKDAAAVSYFQVTLVEKPDEPVGDIFSEGEHRCVALAAFLAELVTAKQYSGIVFDDPMSSLDHIHRKAVAARLVEESAHRQVVVFTHDLAFLFELRREAEAKAMPIHYQTVARKQNRPGFVEAELPMKAKSAWQLGQALRSELKAAKPHFDGWADAKRTIFAKGIIEQLRESWDQGIADFIFPVLGRFDNAIRGTSLFKLAVLEEADVKTVTAARGRLSEELHATAETLNPETVKHSDLLAEVVKLESWLTSIADRQKDAKKPS